LSSKLQVAYIDLRTSVHATEDLDKVQTAICNILPTELLNLIVFKSTGLTGHHGNPISLVEAKIKEKRVAQAVFEKLAQNLPVLDKEVLSSEIDQHLEKGNLYRRLDKQAACLNHFRLSQTDPIHFRIHFKRHRPEEVIEVCRKFGLLP